MPDLRDGQSKERLSLSLQDVNLNEPRNCSSAEPFIEEKEAQEVWHNKWSMRRPSGRKLNGSP